MSHFTLSIPIFPFNIIDFDGSAAQTITVKDATLGCCRNANFVIVSAIDCHPRREGFFRDW